MAGADFIRVQKFLAGVDYPATKEQLVRHARRNQADDQALRALQNIPEGDYGGPDAVSQAVARS